MWRGIELENSENGNSAILEINNSLIENAVCAVKTIANSSTSKAASVIATNSTFKNNCIVLNFGENSPNQNTFSNFNSSNFIIDTNYFGANAVTPNDHILVKLYGTSNKHFRGCNFTVSGQGMWRGIVAEDAGFTVRERCNSGTYNICDECSTPYTRSYFSGFYKAIDVNNSGSQTAFSVKRTDFATGNTQKIWVGSSNNYSISYSNFAFPATPQPSGRLTSYYGICSQNSSGYTISDNHFYQNPSVFNIENIGIYMGNSGTANNILHFNSFENLYKGVYVTLTNGTTSGSPSGLTIACNDFIGNKYDITLSNATIKSEQGSPSTGAGNSFVGTRTSSIYSSGNQQINYYYKNASPFIPYHPSAHINLYAASSSNHLNCARLLCSSLINPRESLERYSELQNHNEDGSNDLEMLNLSNAALHALMSDSVEYFDELIQWYSIINTPIAKYSLVETLFALEKYSEAETVLSTIPSLYEFGEKNWQEHQNYLNFFHFKKNLRIAGQSYEALTASELLELQEIALSTNGRSATMARGVLCFFYGICFEEEENPVEKILVSEDMPDNSEESPAFAPQQSPENNSTSAQLCDLTIAKIYPNPTTGMIYFDNLEEKLVTLYNQTGLLLQSTTKNSLDLSKYPAGIYFVKINNSTLLVIKQ
jgi:hypothetical protein